MNYIGAAFCIYLSFKKKEKEKHILKNDYYCGNF